MNKKIRQFLLQSWQQGFRVFLTLAKIALPFIILIRVLDYYFSIVEMLGNWLHPIMGIVGLPGETGIVLASAILLQIYGALLLLVSLWPQLNLSVAECTILMTMILIAHAFPVELRIAQKAGMRISVAFFIRFFGAFALGIILHKIYGQTWLTEPAQLHFIPIQSEVDIKSQIIHEIKTWLGILIIILSLVTFINLLKITHIEAKLTTLCAPLFSHLGIGQKTVPMAMVGMLLGLSYGGGLLIESSRHQNMKHRDVLCVIALLCLCHSVIEDTLLVMLVDAHWSGVLLGRVLFSFLFIFVFAAIIRRLSDAKLAFFSSRRLVNS